MAPRKEEKGKKNKNLRNHSFIHYLIIGKFISLELYFYGWKGSLEAIVAHFGISIFKEQNFKHQCILCTMFK